MSARPRRLVLGLTLVALSGCRGSVGSDDPSPSRADERDPARAVEPNDPTVSPATGTNPEGPQPAPDADSKTALPTGTCDELQAQWDAADRALKRVCTSKQDCALLWSDYACYALHGADDDLTKLKAVDAAMAATDCGKVECEPPPMHACEAGVCGWDL